MKDFWKIIGAVFAISAFVAASNALTYQVARDEGFQQGITQNIKVQVTKP